MMCKSAPGAHFMTRSRIEVLCRALRYGDLKEAAQQPSPWVLNTVHTLLPASDLFGQLIPGSRVTGLRAGPAWM